MKKMLFTAMILFTAFAASGIQAESFKDKAKRKGCQSSCSAAGNKAKDDCVKKSKEEKQDKSKYEPACNAASKVADDKCVSECMAK